MLLLVLHLHFLETIVGLDNHLLPPALSSFVYDVERGVAVVGRG